MLTSTTAHALCIACVIADYAARSVRLELLVRGLGAEVGYAHTLGANLAEDAGAALTPMRLGGTAVRTMMLSGARGGPRVPVPVTLLAGLAEGGLQTPVVLLAAIGLGAAFAPDWWRTAGPPLQRAAAHAGGWVLVAILLGVLAWLLTRRLLPHRHHSWKERVLDPLRELRRFSRWSLIGCGFLTVVTVAARVAILPLLVRATPTAASIGAVTFGSLVLLYGQVLLPTPSGAGAVELGFLAGGGGFSGGDVTSVLLAWRAYTTFVPVAAGLLAMAVRAIRRGRQGGAESCGGESVGRGMSSDGR